MLYKFKWN